MFGVRFLSRLVICLWPFPIFRHSLTPCFLPPPHIFIFQPCHGEILFVMGIALW